MSSRATRPAGGGLPALRWPRPVVPTAVLPVPVPSLVLALGLAILVVLGTAGLAVSAASAQGADAGAGRFLNRLLHLDDREIHYAVWLPPGYEGGRTWPGVVFLHGAGESGADGTGPTRVGLGPALLAHPERWPCVVILPQKPRPDEEWWEHEHEVLAVVDVCAREFQIDPDRLALTGLSQGGHGAWMLAARHPERWSCVVPLCGYGRALTLVPRLDGIPVWTFHGAKDGVVDPRDTEKIVAALRERRGAGGAEVRFMLVPEVGHAVWDTAYADPALPAWILAQHRNLTARAAAANP